MADKIDAIQALIETENVTIQHVADAVAHAATDVAQLLANIKGLNDPRFDNLAVALQGHVDSLNTIVTGIGKIATPPAPVPAPPPATPPTTGSSA